MKEVSYSNFGKKGELLHEGKYRGVKYYITYSGFCPCCYIEIPEGRYLFNKNYMQITEFECHGGLTFSDDMILSIAKKGAWFVGWDYGHLGDYQAIPYISLLNNGHKWTTSELKEEVEQAIDDNYELIMEEV